MFEEGAKWTRLVPTSRTNTFLESLSLVLVTRQYSVSESGYNHVVFYISNTGATNFALSPSSGFSTSLHYAHVVSGSWNSSQCSVTMTK